MSADLSLGKTSVGPSTPIGSEASLGSEQGATACLERRETRLKEEGLYASDIRLIGEKVPDLDVRLLTPRNGDHFHRIAEDAVSLANQTQKPTVFKFCGSVMVVSPGDTIDSVKAEYRRGVDAAGQEAEVERARSRASFIQEMGETAYMKLPQFLRDWVDGNRRSGYERAIDTAMATDAQLLVNTLGTKEAVLKWSGLGYHAQKEQIPGIHEIYSAASLGVMVRLAVAFADSKEP